MAKYSLLIVALLFLALRTNHSLAAPYRFLASCEPSGYLKPTSNKNCDKSNGAECCQVGKSYPQYECSPAVTDYTPATLTWNDFSEGGDGGDPASCTNKYYKDSELVVALSTGWYNHDSRCLKKIKIVAENGKSVLATVVDECDSVNGCDSAHADQPPCENNIVDASQAVWDALGLDTNLGEVDVHWSDVA
ncbi:hypothetical protein LUZ60_014530 [Juncus effusus]|nr:hypothetical protein LUZ60_014530 [Juncus effusus]